MTRIDLTNAAQIAITCKRGDTFILDLQFWSDAEKTVPIDISGYDFEMEVKDSAGTVILTFTGASEFVVSGAGSNYLKITKSATDMRVDASPAGRPYVYDLEMTDGDGVVSTIMKGTMTIEQDITNA